MKREMTTRLSVIILLICASTVLLGQAFTDFESGGIEGWRVEGDGSITYLATGGNPNGCIRANDNATGDILRTLAPLDYLGDWSMASSTDFISFDLFASVISGPSFSADWMIELSNENNRAVIGTGYLPIFEIWQNYTAILDPTLWTIEQGNWTDLMANVAQIRILTEFISGDEFVLLDNFGVSFNPTLPVLDQQVCSNFESGFEGWSFEGAASVSIEPTAGNPGAAVRINDNLGPVSYAIAPTKFLGDWTALEGSGKIGYDVLVSNFSGAPFSASYMIQISGPGGSAELEQDSSFVLALNNWHRFEWTIDSSEWNVTSGSWSALINRVTEVRMLAEFITGTERVYLDNLCLGNVADCENSPTNLVSTVTASSVLLEWDSKADEGALGYIISGGPIGGGTGTRFVLEPNTSISFPIASLSAGAYQWNVQSGCALDGSLFSPVSVSNTFDVPLAKLASANGTKTANAGSASLAAILNGAKLEVSPNPASTDLLYFSTPMDVWLYSLAGQLVLEKRNCTQLDISGVEAGLYLLKNSTGQSSPLVIQ